MRKGRLPRHGLALLLIAVGLLAVSACRQGGVQDVEFVRGCWVEKTAPGGTVTAMLRLLPATANGKTLTGVLAHYNVDGSVSDRSWRYTLWRDGSKLDLQPVLDTQDPGTPIYVGEARYKARPVSETDVGLVEPSAVLAAFGEGEFASRIFSGTPEDLVIYLAPSAGEAVEVVFRGERDGCD